MPTERDVMKEPEASHAADSLAADPEDPPVSPGDTETTEAPATAPVAASPVVRLVNRLKAAIGLHTNGSLRHNLEIALRDEETDETTFSPEERVLLRNILHLREVRLDDIMVPRADIDAVDENISLDELVRVFRASKHSRMPVFSDTLDDPRGLVHIKDLMAFITAPADRDPETAEDSGAYALCDVDLSVALKESGLIRSVLFAPPSMPATDLMAKMQADRMQMALVIDEYGGTDGLVSLEDIVETVVGDIVDEHDEDEAPMIVRVAEGIWIADARIDLDDAAEAIGEEFDVGDASEEVDTLGGLLFSLIGRVPVRGELISSAEMSGYEIEVLDADPRRIKRLRIYQKRADGRRPLRRNRIEEQTGEAAE